MAVLQAIKHTFTNATSYASGGVDVSLYEEIIIDLIATSLTVAAGKYMEFDLSREDAFGTIIPMQSIVFYNGNSLPTLPFTTSVIFQNSVGAKVHVDMVTNDSPNSKITGTLSVLAKGISLI
jgi:hypothetical protein